MKKYIFILLAGLATMIAGNQAKAQTTAVPFNYGQNATHDTLSNAVTHYLYINSNSNNVYSSGIVGSYEDLGVEFNAKEVSGATGGYAILQSCNDSLLWTNHYGTSADSFALTDVTTDQTKKWAVGPIDFKRYRIKVVPTPAATQKVKLKGSFSVRAKQ